ncbi:anthranilate synthase component I family protein [Streptomyces sp. URMC 125]|uniref:anthranilate synthase component I family protein n=1 Tax=Streptomyces sp. URMC 125 TaxID=3423419 RepID=UPI003F19DC8F
MTAPAAAPPAVGVRTECHNAPRIAALQAYRALAERFGRDQVFLLESAAGPVRDRRYEFVGFGELLSVSVTGGSVRVDGVPPLRTELLRRVAPLLEQDGAAWRLRELRDLWPLLRAVQSAFDAQGSADRFRFGFLGYFGYDTARYIEDLPHRIRRRPDLPDVHLVLHQGCLAADLATGESRLLLHTSPHWPALDADELIALLARAEPAAAEPDTVPEADVADDTTPRAFRDDVERCLRHIAVGDIYQVQIGHELSMRSTADPVDVYRRLCRRNPSPYMYLAAVGGHTVIGASPELFVRVEDGAVTMRPIAGTTPRHRTDDEAAARWLRTDEKEVAEHTMLVDLCRNDIGRIARQDTLAVPDRLTVERYSHVLHLVSTVQGRLEAGRDNYDVIAALFPAGTMTGTPKIRAMEIIEEVEHSRRGLYAGALGLIDVGGYMNLALCIRTLFHHDGEYRTRASAGIVADSLPDREWTETLAKMNAACWAVTGRELV